MIIFLIPIIYKEKRQAENFDVSLYDISSKLAYYIKMSSVTLNVYDISQGMARVLSPGFLGKQLDGIWHTSITVYNIEYFYGGGICWAHPKTTPYGQPVQEIQMGQTLRTKQQLEDYLRSIAPRFTMESYHLLNHNCNNFTDEVMKYLVNQGIPSHIVNLPAEVLNTPMGRTLEPIINSLMQMKDGLANPLTAAPAALPNEEMFGEYLSHEDLFSECNIQKISDHLELTNFMTKEGLLVFWSPADEDFIGSVHILSTLSSSIPIAAVDCLRYSFLAAPKTPIIRVYKEGECMYEIGSIDELVNAVEMLEALYVKA